MAVDLFEQLSQREVPPPPSNLGKRVHERVNQALTLLHVFEVLFKVMPYALLHFGLALVGLISYTITGRFATLHKPSPFERRPSDGGSGEHDGDIMP